MDRIGLYRSRQTANASAFSPRTGHSVRRTTTAYHREVPTGKRCINASPESRFRCAPLCANRDGKQPTASDCYCAPFLHCQTGERCDATQQAKCVAADGTSVVPPKQTPNENEPKKPENDCGGSSSSSCKDLLGPSTCAAIFVDGSACQIPGTSMCMKTPDSSFVGLRSTALKCAKTCQLCYETAAYGCEDNPG